MRSSGNETRPNKKKPRPPTCYNTVKKAEMTNNHQTGNRKCFEDHEDLPKNTRSTDDTDSNNCLNLFN